MRGHLIIGLLRSLRPKQWTKNLLLFAGYLFTIDQGHSVGALLRVIAAFGLFCAASGAGYLINDTIDAGCDRAHPRKCKRPVASGQVPIAMAIAAASILGAVSIGASLYLDLFFGVLMVAYCLLTLAYSISLKHVVIVDLLVIASGFVIRAAAGAVVIHVAISLWLLVCTSLLALFLGLAKRRGEVVTLENGGCDHRKTLSDYSKAMLDQMLSITAAAALMAYFLYTFTPGSKTGSNHPYMMITVPFVIYGLFRYLYLVHGKNAGVTPEQALLDDKPLLVNLLLYVAAVAVAMKL